MEPAKQGGLSTQHAFQNTGRTVRLCITIPDQDSRWIDLKISLLSIGGSAVPPNVVKIIESDPKFPAGYQIQEESVMVEGQFEEVYHNIAHALSDSWNQGDDPTLLVSASKIGDKDFTAVETTALLIAALQSRPTEFKAEGGDQPDQHAPSDPEAVTQDDKATLSQDLTSHTGSQEIELTYELTSAMLIENILRRLDNLPAGEELRLNVARKVLDAIDDEELRWKTEESGKKVGIAEEGGGAGTS